MIWVSKLRRYHCWLVLILIVLAAIGCSSKKAFVKEPTPLDLFPAQQIKVVKSWDVTFSTASKHPLPQAYQPTFSPGRVYISDQKGVIQALSADKSTPIWQYSTGLKLTSGLGFGDGLLVVGGRDGDVLAIDSLAGSLLWRGKVSSEVLIAPLAIDGIVYVRSVDGKLTALSANDGHRLWSYQEKVPSLSLHGLSMPLVDQDRIFIGFADGRIAALNKFDGRELWQIAVAVPQGRSELERLIDIDADLVQYDDVLFATAYHGRVVAIDKRSGRFNWVRDLSSYHGLLVDEQAVYLIDDDDGVWAISRRNGATLWKQEALLQRTLTTPLLIDGHIIVGDVEGYVHWLNVSDGSFAGRVRVGKKAVTVLKQDANKAVYALSANGYLTKLIAVKQLASDLSSDLENQPDDDAR